MIVTKIEVARCQLNTAIRLFFSNQDPVSAHTLAGAASVIFSDLVEISYPDKSWDKHAQLVNKLSAKAYYQIAREAQNFFKHARSDPEGKLDFKETDTETIMMFGALNCGELQTLSTEMSVFQLWYLAARANVFGTDFPLIKEALNFFPGTEALERPQKISLGRKVLNETLTESHTLTLENIIGHRRS
jgi:hypothetical protein